MSLRDWRLWWQRSKQTQLCTVVRCSVNITWRAAQCCFVSPHDAARDYCRARIVPEIQLTQFGEMLCALIVDSVIWNFGCLVSGGEWSWATQISLQVRFAGRVCSQACNQRQVCNYMCLMHVLFVRSATNILSWASKSPIVSLARYRQLFQAVLRGGRSPIAHPAPLAGNR